MEAMQRLITEADSRFGEKLRMCASGQPTNMHVYSDRTYNLRHQVAHNPQLTTDPHFMSMLSATETCLAPEYAAQGERDKLLNSLLSGLLKTLLKEAVACNSYSLRKVLVEMIWHWHQEKQREVLDFALQQQFPQARSSRPSTRDGGMIGETVPSSSSPEPDGRRQVMESQLAVTEVDDVEALQSQCKAQQRPVDISGNTIAHKLSQYKRRNLGVASEIRSDPAAAVAATPVVVYTKDAKTRQKHAAAARALHADAFHQFSGPPTYTHLPTGAPRYEKNASGTQMVVDPSKPLVAAELKAMHHAARKLGEEHDEAVRLDVLAQLAGNQSRLEEESARRIESSSYCAQTGVTCFRNRSRTTEVGEGPVPDCTKYSGFSFSPYDQRRLSPQEQLRIRRREQSMREAAFNGKGYSAPDISDRRGLMDPLDVMEAPDCVTTLTAPCLDAPISDQLHGVVAAPSARQLEQLVFAERLRNSFASEGGKAPHYPRGRALKAALRPVDEPIEACLALLPRPGSALPRNPFLAPPKSKKKKAA